MPNQKGSPVVFANVCIAPQQWRGTAVSIETISNQVCIASDQGPHLYAEPLMAYWLGKQMMETAEAMLRTKKAG